MTAARVFPAEMVDAAAKWVRCRECLANPGYACVRVGGVDTRVGNGVLHRVRSMDALAALSAAGDALEGGPTYEDGFEAGLEAGSAERDALVDTIRAEALAPVAALLEADYKAQCYGQRATIDPDVLSEVLADPDAVANHNAAIWDEGYRRCMAAVGAIPPEGTASKYGPPENGPFANPYRATEGRTDHE